MRLTNHNANKMIPFYFFVFGVFLKTFAFNFCPKMHQVETSKRCLLAF